MNEVTYKEFRVGDLFDIHPTKAYKGNNSDLFSSNGTIPVVANTSVNNGIGGFSELEPTENGGIITFSDTTTSDAVFYQPNDFIGYSHVQGMYPYSNKWTEKALLYFLSSFKSIASSLNFDYANKFNRKIAANFIISLPSTLTGEPDYDFMDRYISELEQERISELEQERISELEQYLAVTGLDNYEMTEEDLDILLECKQVGAFRVGDIFTQERGKESSPSRVSDGNIPMIAEIENNNGFTKTATPSKTFQGNAITISVNFAKNVFYQPNDFCASVNILILRNDYINEKSAQYIISVLKANNQKYNYQHKISKERLNNTILFLPITSHGEPDYEYMEKYIRVQEKLAIKGVVEYKERVIGETKRSVG